ncbi:hypothetical protein CkaCkLH20_08974 [Colletotrichum karsti]|uniref:Uncharacterized protein n=1 Tax=Colletotrichum karsti TaxID=1095194 RepID=A0A9P6I0E3_9PEZI|nr:uncharacterized protein CkaCkLH20_08974 [Colletotrichum karsti]KAF9873515.1 hypothetical protein CkaCkLH20_08974 [Colletotrichum karsti]
MPPRDIPQDTNSSDTNKDCTAWDSELLKGVLICSGIAVVLFVILCEVLVYRHKEKQGRVQAEQQVKHLTEHYEGIIALQESTIAIYVNQWGQLPQHLIDGEERNPGRHTDPGVPVASGSQPPRAYVRWNAHQGVDERERGSNMRCANGGGSSDRLPPLSFQNRSVPENARPGVRTLPDGSDTFVVSVPDDVSDDYSADGGPSSSSRYDRQRDGQVSPVSSNASVRNDHDLSASVSSGRSLTHGRRDLTRDQRM